jgi:hypothetical protein
MKEGYRQERASFSLWGGATIQDYERSLYIHTVEIA